MATKNRRVAAYLPPQVDEAFIAFKIQRGLATEENPSQNDSQALVQLLSEFLGVAQQVSYPVSHSSGTELATQLETLKAELVTQISELSSELSILKGRVDALTVAQDLTDALTTADMAKRIGINSSTLSHWKKGKTPQQLRNDIQQRDPEGIAWVYIAEINRFKRESDIPGVLQCELLSTSANSLAQVNPLPEGSERSGEG